MHQRLSDYVADFLFPQGVADAFYVDGVDGPRKMPLRHPSFFREHS